MAIGRALRCHLRCRLLLFRLHLGCVLHHALDSRLHVGVQATHQLGKALRLGVLNGVQRLCERVVWGGEGGGGQAGGVVRGWLSAQTAGVWQPNCL